VEREDGAVVCHRDGRHGDCAVPCNAQSRFSHVWSPSGLAALVEDDGGLVLGGTGPPSSDRDIRGETGHAREPPGGGSGRTRSARFSPTPEGGGFHPHNLI